MTPWLTAGDKFSEAEPRMLKDNVGMLHCGASVGGNKEAVGENVSSADHFTPGFECCSFAGRKVD